MVYFIVFFHDMPWHPVALPVANFPRHLPRYTTEPSTDLHGIPWNPIPNPNPNLGAVNIGVPWGLPLYSVGIPWSAVAVAAGVAMVPLVACHGTLHGEPWNPIPHHGMSWGWHGMP